MISAKYRTKILALALYRAAQDKSQTEVDQVLANFFHYLVKRGLVSRIPAIIRELENIFLAEHGIAQAEVTAMSALDAATLSKIEKFLIRRLNSKVKITTKESPDLLGGLCLRYQDKIIDFSLKHHLRNLAKQLSD